MTKSHSSGGGSGQSGYNANSYWSSHKSTTSHSVRSSSSNTSTSSKRTKSVRTRRSNSSRRSTSSKSTRKSAVIKQKLKSFKFLQKSIKMPSNIRSSRKSVVADADQQSSESQIADQQQSYSSQESAPPPPPPPPPTPPPQRAPPQQNYNKHQFGTLESKLSKSFRGMATNSVKLKLDASGFKDGDSGSIFIQKVEKDDSALHLLAATIKEDEELRQEETEIFVPGKGELRCSFS